MRGSSRSGQVPPPGSEPVGRGQLPRLAYRLGLAHATGVLSIFPPSAEPELLVLRRGRLVTTAVDALGRRAAQRLARLASLEAARYHFDGGTAAHPPGASNRQISLAAWARSHLEGQLDTVRAQDLVRTLAGIRLSVRPDLVPDDALCDDVDRRILAAMTPPRRLDQIWPLARTPRFRLLSFIYFLRGVGALELVGVAAPAPSPGLSDAARLLGVPPGADPQTVKRAYRRLARVLHPDLQPWASVDQRRRLENKLAAINAAYEELTSGPRCPDPS